MKWTREQQEAIELRNKNILVAAAAGSGKTAVLVERIKRLILEERCPVDRMLIVTFTNAAAAEMKEKIRNSISDTLAQLMGEVSSKGTGGHQESSRENRGETVKFLKRQLDSLSTANISTFHAFALDVIRRYFYIIQIEPDFKICDTIQETLLKEEAMDRLLEELFEEQDPEFFHFLKCYSGDRDEGKFRSLILKSYDTIRSLPEPFDWLKESVRQLKEGEGLGHGPAGEYLFKLAKEKGESAGEAIRGNMSIAETHGLAALADLCDRDLEQVEMLIGALEEDDYEAVRNAINQFKLPTMSSKIFSGAEDPEGLKELVAGNRNFAKKQVKELKEVYFSGNFDELKHEMNLTYRSGLYLQVLLTRYHELYKEKKAERNLADFSDIEHYAYRILKDEEAAEFYRHKFNHIFIDEYQDSNVIQEALIDLIKRPTNLFMVGDVKQSIYKFRLAEPEIFQNKYRSYAEGLVENSVKIDLNKNFRSKAPVIDFINKIFTDIMEGYDEKAALHQGDPWAEKSYHSPEFFLTQVPWGDEREIDEELRNIIKAEKEALAAAKIIRDSLGETIFDSKKEMERPLEKRDIVILMRGVRNYGDVFQKVLVDNNIPAYIDDNDGFFNTMEIEAFLSALYIIDNPKQDIPLLTLMRSEMLGFSIEEMVQIRIECKKGSYYTAFKNYSIEGKQLSLREKCHNALEKIGKWRELSRIMPLDRLVWQLLMDTGFYITMGAMPAGSQRQANLRALTDKALAYQRSGGGSLYGFIRYIEAIKEKKVAMGQVKLMGEKDDLVRIMTVHKSKGLEFPMVLLAGFCRRLTYSSAGKAPMMHKDLGIGFPIVDPENRWYKTTLLQNMIKERFHREEVEEEKRILYVALTRAKDRLVVLGICNDAEEDLEKVKTGSPKDSSYFTMAGKALCLIPGVTKIVGDESFTRFSQKRRVNTDKILSFMDEVRERGHISSEVSRLMEFEYPHEKELTVKSKYSVSEINGQRDYQVKSLAEPLFAAQTNKLNSMERGTVYHTLLEHMDMKEAHRGGEEYIRTLIKDLMDQEILLEEETKVLDVEKLRDFAASALAGRMAESRALYKEKPFNLLTEYEGSRVIVQGIIDCFFEEEGQLVLVDYKTGNSRDIAAGKEEVVRQRYAGQMELYKKALEEATGKKVKEIYLYLTDVGKVIAM